MRKIEFIELSEDLVNKFDELGYVITFPRHGNGKTSTSDILSKKPDYDVDWLPFADGYKKASKLETGFYANNLTGNTELDDWLDKNYKVQEKYFSDNADIKPTDISQTEIDGIFAEAL